MKAAGIIRKSPTKSTEESIDVQKKSILQKAQSDFPNQKIEMKWVIDICSGDDPNRKKLLKHFNNISDYKINYCYNVDRFSRSWLGLKWFHEYFTDGTEIRFCTGIGDLYNKDGSVNPDIYLQFFIFCGFAQYELLRIRSRIKAGISRIKKNPKLRAEKYKGGVKGRTWKK